MTDFREIPVDQIEVRARLREIDEPQVEKLKSSILDVGLIHPVSVYPIDDGIARFGLISGAHRLEVYRRLGYAEIPAQVRELAPEERIIAECDENLCGPKVSPADEAIFTRARQDAYEALHPETKHGSPGVSRQVGDTRERAESDRFTADTAAKTGQSERAVQRNAERGKKITPEALKKVKGTALDKGAYLDKLKKVPAAEQVEKVKRDLATPAKKGGIAGRYSPAAPKQLTAEERLSRYLKLMDEVEALDVSALVKGAGRKRAVVGQRAASAILKLNSITEALA